MTVSLAENQSHPARAALKANKRKCLQIMMTLSRQEAHLAPFLLGSLSKVFSAKAYVMVYLNP